MFDHAPMEGPVYRYIEIHLKMSEFNIEFHSEILGPREEYWYQYNLTCPPSLNSYISLSSLIRFKMYVVSLVFQLNNTKIYRNIGSVDFDDLPCNCNRSSKVDRKCMYNGECRKSILVYKAECKDCKMCYIGNTR